MAESADRTRILCLDVGDRRTGVAICDETRTLASPITVIDNRDPVQVIAQVIRLVDSHEAGLCLVGLPLNHHGESGKDAARVQKFIAALRERLTVPVLEWDERLTSVEAEQILIGADFSRKARKAVIDKVAATIILQSYLDHLKFHLI